MNINGLVGIAIFCLSFSVAAKKHYQQRELGACYIRSPPKYITKPTFVTIVDKENPDAPGKVVDSTISLSDNTYAIFAFDISKKLYKKDPYGNDLASFHFVFPQLKLDNLCDDYILDDMYGSDAEKNGTYKCGTDDQGISPLYGQGTHISFGWAYDLWVDPKYTDALHMTSHLSWNQAKSIVWSDMDLEGSLPFHVHTLNEYVSNNNDVCTPGCRMLVWMAIVTRGKNWTLSIKGDPTPDNKNWPRPAPGAYIIPCRQTWREYLYNWNEITSD